MGKSYAEIATGCQGSENYPGHDTYQNGIINVNCNRIYMAGWQNDWASATWTDDQGIDHLSASGYFTDQATIDSCMNGDKLNTNKLDSALQTKLSDFSSSSYDADGNKIQGNFQAHSNVSAYDIDHDRLAELKTENPDLYNCLTNPDGLSPDGGRIKAAYGQAEANPQHGSGGGNQYYIDPQTFKAGQDAGVFKYNPGASFSMDGSTGRGIERSDISPEDYGAFDGGKYNNDLIASTDADKEKMNSMAAERSNSGQSESEQINSQRVTENPGQPYITDPDPAYKINSGINYGGETSNNEKSEGIRCQNSGEQEQNTSKGMPTGTDGNQGVVNPEQSTSKGIPTGADGNQGVINPEQSTSKGMPTGADGNQGAVNPEQSASKGMPTTASGQSGSTLSKSSEHSRNMGQSM